MEFSIRQYALCGLMFPFFPVKSVHPISLEKVDQENKRTAAPGNGVGPGYGFQFVYETNRNSNIAEPEQTPTAKHGEHGDRWLSGTPKNSGNTVRKSQKEIKQTDGPHMPCAVIYDLWLTVEEANQMGRKEVKTDAHELCKNGGTTDAEKHTFFDPVIFLGAKILADKGRKCLGKTGDRQESEAFYFRVGAAAGHGSFAKAVNIGLDHHIGNGNNGILNTGRKTVSDDLTEAGPVETDLPDLQLIGLRGAQQLDTAQRRADSLGDGGGQGGRPNTVAKNTYKEKIQCHIDKG